MLAIRRCRYCGEYFDAEVGSPDSYCENCQQIMELLEEDEDYAGLAYADDEEPSGEQLNQDETVALEAFGFAPGEETVTDELPEDAFELAESIDFQIENGKTGTRKGHQQKEYPIDDFRSAIKGTRMAGVRSNSRKGTR